MKDDAVRVAMGRIITLSKHGQIATAISQMETLDREHLAPLRGSQFAPKNATDRCALLKAYLETARTYLATGDALLAERTLDRALGAWMKKHRI